VLVCRIVGYSLHNWWFSLVGHVFFSNVRIEQCILSYKQQHCSVWISKTNLVTLFTCTAYSRLKLWASRCAETVESFFWETQFFGSPKFSLEKLKTGANPATSQFKTTAPALYVHSRLERFSK
jgi:hypothetical protein